MAYGGCIVEIGALVNTDLEDKVSGNTLMEGSTATQFDRRLSKEFRQSWSPKRCY